MGKLTDVQLRNWIKAGKPLAIADGDGLTFTLSPKGTAAWTLRYRAAGKAKELTLGRYPDISLVKAREIATAKRAEIQQGVDVAAEKRRADKAAAQAWTFRKLAEDYFEKAADYLADATIRSRTQQLRDYVYPKIGGIAAADVTPADVVGIVEATATKSLHVASWSWWRSARFSRMASPGTWSPRTPAPISRHAPSSAARATRKSASC